MEVKKSETVIEVRQLDSEKKEEKKKHKVKRIIKIIKKKEHTENVKPNKLVDILE